MVLVLGGLEIFFKKSQATRQKQDKSKKVRGRGPNKHSSRFASFAA